MMSDLEDVDVIVDAGEVFTVIVDTGDEFPEIALGRDGASAYELWLGAGNSGTVDDFLASIPSLSCTAGGAALSGHRVVAAADDGTLSYASYDDMASMAAIIGVSTGAALAGQPIQVRSSGRINEPSWSWSRGPIFCGANGQLVQPAPVIGIVRVIGVALGPHSMLVSVQPMITL